MSEQPNTETNNESNEQRSMSRRRFLKILGIGTGGLAIGAVAAFPIIRREAQLAINSSFSSFAPAADMPESPFVWIQIDPDNTAHLHMPKSEMGQGIHTTIAQIAAEDLELDWEAIQTYHADTDIGFTQFTSFTFGSSSTISLYQPVREIAATMKQMLVTEAATQMNVDSDALNAQNSRVFLKSDTSRGMTYGEIIASHQGEWVLPDTTPTLKPNNDFNFIGKPMQRVDFKAKVTGRAIYGFDARLDGMRYGAVARPPRYGAELIRVSAGDAENQAGVVAVVIRDGFAGIVAESRSQAHAALAHLDLEWDGGTTWSQDDVDTFMSIPDENGTLVQRVGQLDAILRDNQSIIEAEYSVPMASHAHLEPQSALVHVQDEGTIVYCSTQAPTTTRNFVARAIDVDSNTVNVFPTYLGGGFGRKLGTNASVEAAILSQATGLPVHVGWTREEEMRYGYHRPPSKNHVRAVLDDNQQIIALEHTIASGDIMYGSPNVPNPDLLAAILGADPLALTSVEYGIPNLQVRYHRKALPIPTGSWRGLGTMPNTFAVESFIDELAHQADIDPLQMRLNHLPDNEFGQRMRAVLETVADASDWQSPPANHTYGLALGHLGQTIVALVADISVTDTRYTVHRVWCAVDAGLIVNPDGARAQVEGTIVMGLSSVRYEALTVQDGMITANNFGQYPLITMRDIPEINTLFVQSSDVPIGGLGEPVIGVVPPAIANALFTATGQRLRQLPLRLA